MANPITAIAQPGNVEIVITRLVKAPQALAYEAFTDPVHVDNWWGPRGFTTTTKSMDVRPGGRWEHVMHGPDGTDYPNLTEYLEVDPPRKLVYRISDGKADDPAAFISTVTFTAEDGGTRVEMRSTFQSVEARDHVIEHFGAIEGGLQTLDRFEEHLAASGAAQQHLFILTRLFKAPRELVWKAYTEAEHLKHWWGPTDWTVPFCEVDLRVGGNWFYCMRGPDGTESWGKATYREILPPERLAYTDAFVDADGNEQPGMPKLPVTVEFMEQPGGRTSITSRVTFASREERDQIIEMGMEVGIGMTFDRLAAHLAELQA